MTVQQGIQMKAEYRSYQEKFPYILDVQHKVTPYTEKSGFHLHTQMEIIYTCSDNLIFYSENSVFRVPANTLLLINSMTLHYLAYFDDGRDCDRYVLTFSPDIILRLNTPEFNLLDCFLHKTNDGLAIHIPQAYQFQIQKIFDDLTDATSRFIINPETEEAMLLQSMDLLCMSMDLGKLLLQINRHLYKEIGRPIQASFNEHSRLAAEVCSYIDLHFDEPLSANEIAHRFSVSRTQMYNIFREILRMSVNEYIQYVRMNQAKMFLIQSDYSIEIISQKVGYGNISSFSRIFKSQVGMNPLQYRKTQRESLTA